jgi:hypothetical protein
VLSIVLLLLHVLCTCLTVLYSLQQQAAASVTTATTANDLFSDVAVRGSNNASDLPLLTEHMHAAAFADDFMTWLPNARGNDVTLQQVRSDLQRFERYYGTGSNKLPLIRHASRLLTSLVQERGVTFSTASSDDSRRIFRHWLRRLNETSTEALEQLQKVRGTFPFPLSLNLQFVAVLSVLCRHTVHSRCCLVLCIVACIDAQCATCAVSQYSQPTCHCTVHMAIAVLLLHTTAGSHRQ